MRKFVKNLIWFFSPCRKCKEKDLEGLVACYCTKGIFEKKWHNIKKRLNRWQRKNS